MDFDGIVTLIRCIPYTTTSAAVAFFGCKSGGLCYYNVIGNVIETKEQG